MAVAVAVRNAFETHIKLVETQNTAGHVLLTSEELFYVADLGDIVRKWIVWKEALPDVTPFFGKHTCSWRTAGSTQYGV
jgi:hypothetical protein